MRDQILVKNNGGRMEEKFIKTSDISTYETLLKLGFKLIDKTGNYYTFLNSPKKDSISFSSNIDISKIKCCNILCI